MKKALTALMLTGLVLSVGCHHKKKAKNADEVSTPVAPVMAPAPEAEPMAPEADPDAPKGPPA